jgi:hypothetical protein
MQITLRYDSLTKQKSDAPFGSRGTEEKGYEEVQNQHYILFSNVFSATKRNAREKIGSNAEENSPEEKDLRSQLPALGFKKNNENDQMKL